ncbi:mannitol dehydrogenase family protein [Chelativorans sp.]|uniref:mannitol dehydrogenase family protein n=1 Tax=Chelativorans sp. TaxID=2203393 RepID=UPI00281169D8|nr:mannitol dehydrogenase family protein [Chelativorans sp.]
MIFGRAAVPRYDRAGLRPGILHFGVGNFHRAHQALYIDDLFNGGRDLDWAILGAGVREADEQMRRRLADQDFLTTVVEQEADRSSARITGSMIGFLPPGDIAAIVGALADPAIRVVSMTITEGGYFLDPASGRFDPGHPEIVADGADPESPRTVFGLIIAGLKRRRAEGTAPFTVMSCDNLRHNGSVTRDAVVGLARLSDPAFAAWIEESVAFPNSMVDRITPATGDRERRALEEEFGIVDGWPVFCESYRQWVLEDNFPAGRPALEQVGVEFVQDVAPFETMKIRILNGGHSLLAYAAALLDVRFVHEAMANPLLHAFLRKVEQDEIIPVVPPVPGTDLLSYFRRVEERFANPKIADTAQRLCYDGSNKLPKFILPTISDRLEKGLDATGLALEVALWCRYCFGTTESGVPIAPNDPNWHRLQAAAETARSEPAAWLALTDIFGDLGLCEPFRKSFGEALNMLWRDGTERTLQRYVGDSVPKATVYA